MKLFIRKIYESGYPEDKPPKDRVTFILQKFAEWFPFENTDVMNHNIDPVTPAFLIKKMVTASRGGLCYEINPLLYLVLKELGFRPTLAAATVKNKDEWVLDGTHALVLLEIDHEKYIADSGFGNRLALAPLQLDGPEVISPAGAFRLRSVSTEKGAVVMEHSADHEEWSICYAFDWAPVTWESLNRMKKRSTNIPVLHLIRNCSLRLFLKMEQYPSMKNVSIKNGWMALKKPFISKMNNAY